MTVTLDVTRRPLARPRDQWLAALRVAGPIWAVFTALRYLVAVVTEYFFQPDHGRLAQGVVGVLKLPFTFDSGYFKEIAQHGYFDPARNAPEWRAFFPGYPLVMRGVASVTTFGLSDGRVMIAGALISAICSLVATVIIYRLASESPLLRSLGDRLAAATATVTGPPGPGSVDRPASTGGETIGAGSAGLSPAARRAGTTAAVLLMVWPTATFLTAAYSESLFLALATAAWWNALRGRWWWAGALCAYASLTRINGVFLMAALLVLLLVRVAQRQERLRWTNVLAVLLGASGAAAYFLYLWVRTGDPLAWSHAQKLGWGRETVAPWVSLQNTLDAIRGIDDPLRQAQWIIDIAAVAGCLVFAAYLLRRRCWAELTLVLITVAVLASSFNYLSVMRNTLTLFPIFVIGGVLLSRRREWVTAMLLTLSGVWMVATTALFTLTAWVG